MIGKVIALLLISGIVLTIIGIFIFFHTPGQREEVGRFMNDSYSSWLLYAQTCTIGNIRNEIPINTLQEEAEYCNQTAANNQAGYYVYDFNIRRSVYVDDNFMNALTNDILLFPSSFYKLVKNGSNEFNTITPLNEFTEFDISCENTAKSLTCIANGEVHLITQSENLDLLIPQGMVQGPDWYKLLKPKFFPPSY